MFPRSLPLFALSLLLAACANDIRVTSDWEPASDLTSRRTFALATGPETGVIAPGGRSREIGTAFYRTRVENAILGELLASGRAEATAQQAQVRVVWGAQSETRHETDTVAFRNYVPYQDPWRIDRYETREYRREEQTLTVTLQEPASGKVLWTGSVCAPEIDGASPEDREKRVRELVRRLFAKLPKPATR